MLYSDLKPTAQKKALSLIRTGECYLNYVKSLLREDARKAMMEDGYSNLPIHISYPHVLGKGKKKPSIDVCLTLKTNTLLEIEQILSFSNVEDLPLSYPEKLRIMGVYSLNGCGVKVSGDLRESESLILQVEKAVREWLSDVGKNVHRVSLVAFDGYYEDEFVLEFLNKERIVFDNKGMIIEIK